jgi:signal peptidase I
MSKAKKHQRNNGNNNPGSQSKLLAFAKELLTVFFFVLIINSFVVAAFEVPTSSMEDTVKVGDRLLVNKFLYGGTTPYTIPLTSIRIPHFRLPGFRNVRRGDVIVFDWPGQRDQVEKQQPQMFYLKRCVALPGDTIRIDQRKVYINNQLQLAPSFGKYLRFEPIPAGYANPDIFPRTSDFNQDNYGPIVVPKKGMKLSLSPESFPAWDVFIRREGHSAAVEDGRILIDGKPATGYVVERDYAFAMGDNRDNSLDSRFWGFVPIEDIIGTPMIVFWSWDPHIPIYHPIDKLLSINPGRIGTIIR